MPETAPTFDLDALIAESEHRPFLFKFGGETFELPAQPSLRFIACVRDADRDPLGVAQALFTPEQWRTIEDMDVVLTVEHLGALIKAYFQHCREAQGESSASTAS